MKGGDLHPGVVVVVVDIVTEEIVDMEEEEGEGGRSTGGEAGVLYTGEGAEVIAQGGERDIKEWQ